MAEKEKEVKIKTNGLVRLKSSNNQGLIGGRLGTIEFLSSSLVISVFQEIDSHSKNLEISRLEQLQQNLLRPKKYLCRI